MNADELLAKVSDDAGVVHRCKHNWKQVFFGQKYWAPGTWMYQCMRCNAMRMTILKTEEKE